METNVLSIVIALCCVSFAFSQNLRCYDCSPMNSKKECDDPENLNARMKLCNSALNETLCLSAFYMGTGDEKDKTGVYRGCLSVKSDVRDVCEWFIEQHQTKDIKIVSCLPCSTSRCNKQLFDDKGLPRTSNSPINTFSIFTIVLVASAFFL